MSWFQSFIVAILTAITSAVLAGVVATLAVRWYEVSSFEGGSGYFVVGFILLGIVCGLLIGLVSSRIIAAGAQPGVLKALGVAQLVSIAVVAIVGGTARLLADVAPEIGGQPLMLVVEMRWPRAQVTSPALDTGVRYVSLRSVSGGSARASAEGPLWLEDARQEDGHWIVPGAVEVFTSRGDRVLSIEPAGEKDVGFLVPLPAYPGAAQLQWSEWLPRARAGAPAVADGLTYRFKVVKRDAPVRVQTFGNFEAATIASSFSLQRWGDRPWTIDTKAQFLIFHRGKQVIIEGLSGGRDSARGTFDRADAVALLPGAPDALLVKAATEHESGPVYLVVSEGVRVRTEYVTPHGAPGMQTFGAALVTSDTARFRRDRDARSAQGVVDRERFASPGTFLFGDAVLTTQPASVMRYTAELSTTLNPNVPPLGLSPDGARFARIGFLNNTEAPVLIVTDVRSGISREVPIDVARTRVGDVSVLDPAWLAHYYAWTPDGAGGTMLTARSGVTPLPYRGVLSNDDGFREYHVLPAGEGLFGAFTTFLRTEMRAVRTPADEAAYGYQVQIDGRTVHVFNRDDTNSVGVFMERGTDTRLVATIAARFDAALATGAYDRYFAVK